MNKLNQKFTITFDITVKIGCRYHADAIGLTRNAHVSLGKNAMFYVDLLLVIYKNNGQIISDRHIMFAYEVRPPVSERIRQLSKFRHTHRQTDILSERSESKTKVTEENKARHEKQNV